MPNWIIFIPSVLVIIVAILKRDVILSLAIGIISAGLIATNFSIPNATSLIFNRTLDETDLKTLYHFDKSPDHLYTFGFLIILGIIISLITHTGGVQAYSNIIKKRLKTKKSTESTSLILSIAFFLDDYLNNLIVGCVMRPLTDSFKIPRAKLAFLLDSMSSTLCVLIPASSWVAFILTQLESSGVSSDNGNNISILAEPFSVYLKSIPYMVYPIFIFISSWFIIRNRISFGSMQKHEQIAEETGNLFGNKQPMEIKVGKCGNKGSVYDFVIPIGSFIAATIAILLYTGNWYFLGGNNTLLNSLLNSDPLASLFLASLFSLMTSIIFLKAKKSIDFTDIKLVSISGFHLMKNSLLVLLLAWTFATIVDKDLSAGIHLSNLLLQTLPAFVLPLTIFITSLLISASTGSAWGTIAVTTPLALPIVVAFTQLPIPITPEQTNLLYPIIGALISGAVAGGHISPISDATVISATSAGSYHMDHVITQLNYIIAPIIATIFALLFTGVFSSYNSIAIQLISIIGGIFISIGILILLNYIFSKNKA